MTNIHIVIWLFFVFIQTCCIVLFFIKNRQQQKKWDQEFKNNVESGLDTQMFLVYNSKAYWIEKNSMVRAKYEGKKVFLSTKEKVDPFKIKDVSISEYMDILKKLEKEEDVNCSRGN